MKKNLLVLGLFLLTVVSYGQSIKVGDTDHGNDFEAALTAINTTEDSVMTISGVVETKDLSGAMSIDTAIIKGITADAEIKFKHDGTFKLNLQDSVLIRDLKMTSDESTTGVGGLITISGRSATLINVTIYNCKNNSHGGALFIGAGPTLIDSCTFEGNSATGIGGAVWCDAADYEYTISNCLFKDNMHIGADPHGKGGAIGHHGSPQAKALVINTLFEGNHAKAADTDIGGHGGAVYIQSSAIDFVNCTFYKNKAGKGGAIQVRHADVTLGIINCTFAFNETYNYESQWGGYTGALHLVDAAGDDNKINVHNCIFSGNKHVNEDLSEILMDIGGDNGPQEISQLTNSIVAVYDNERIKVTGESDFLNEPAAEMATKLENNVLVLSEGSNAINIGDPQYLKDYTKTDARGLCRWGETEDDIDAGAYDSEAEECDEEPESIFDFELSGKLNVYPNPANNMIYISGLNSTSYTLNIYNTIGMLVYSKNVNQASSIQSVDINNLTKGIYIVNCISDGQSYNERLIVK